MEEKTAPPPQATPIMQNAQPPPPPADPHPTAPQKHTSVWFIIGILILIGATAGGIVAYQQSTSNPMIEKIANPTPPLKQATPSTSMSPEIEAILTKKMTALEKLASDSALVAAVEASGNKDASLTKDQITSLDTTWKNTKGDSDFSKQFLNNPTALILKKFQESNPGYPEIFVTNKEGLNVGQTNKTSDYLQSDEAWWTTAYNSGRGKATHGDIEYDESAQSRSVSLYVPVYGTDNNVVGIIKAVLDIASIQQDL